MGIFTKKSKDPKTILSIPAMSCGHCEKTITDILLQIDGVESVKADASRKEAVVTGSASFETLKEALSATAYIPSLKR